MSGITPQQRTRNNLTARGYLVGSVERRKRFPDRKKHACNACGHVPMIEISADLFEVFDLVAFKPGRLLSAPSSMMAVTEVLPHQTILVQTTSRANHSARRNKILASMEAKLVLLAGVPILIQSWRLEKRSRRWQFFDEWITLEMYAQAPHYPNTVAELQEIKRRAKAPDLPPGATLPLAIVADEEMPF